MYECVLVPCLFIKNKEQHTATAKDTAISTSATATYRYGVLGSDAVGGQWEMSCQAIKIFNRD